MPSKVYFADLRASLRRNLVAKINDLIERWAWPSGKNPAA